MNKSDVLTALNQLQLKPNKRLGQNFLINAGFLKKIVLESEISKDDVILEVGPGLGALTEELANNAKKVYAYEIDGKLYAYLKSKFSNISNLEIMHADILKTTLPIHNKVVSNVPYSITGPLLEKLFFKKNPPEGVLTLEKSLADRIFFNGNRHNFSRIMVSFNAFMKPVSRYGVPNNAFYPPTKIEQSLIKITPRKDLNEFLLKDENKDFFLKFVAGIMPFKNKNVANALELYLKNLNAVTSSKEKIIALLEANHFVNSKLISYNVKDIINLSKNFFSVK